MPWTPLSGAQFENVFGPSKKARRQKRSRRPKAGKQSRVQPRIESLEERQTPALTANVLATSLASTPGTDVTIGEIVRYRVQVEVPADNTVYSALNFNAALPSGLTYLDDGSTRIALVSDGGITSSLAPAGSGLYVSGDENNIAGITPTFVLPGGAITNSANGVNFASGITQVNDNDANVEYILIEFNALVNNAGTSAADSNDAGDVLTGSFQLIVNGTPDGSPTDTGVTVVEPSITDLSKTDVESPDATFVTYTVAFSNAAGPNSSTAYNVRVLDPIPDGLHLDPASITIVGGTGVTNRSTADLLDLTFDAVAPGGSVTITYVCTSDPAVRDGRVIENIVDLDYTSLPDTNGETPNPTGSTTPGAPGTATGERDGSGGVNDYVGTASTIVCLGPIPASISGFVKCDLAPFFVHGSNDFPGIEGVTIRLLDSATGNEFARTVTDANGFYEFTGLAPGTYRVEEVQPAGTLDSFDMVGFVNGQVTGFTGPNDGIGTDFFDGIVLAPGDMGTEYCFFDVCDTAQMSGFVKCINLPGEPGIENVLITLVDSITGAVIDTTRTDANGFFQFINLAPGTYRLEETQPPDSIDEHDQAGTVNGQTRGFVGPNNGIGTDFIDGIVLNTGENSVMNCFLEICLPMPEPSFITGSVYCDANGNGIRDAGEPGLAGVTLHVTQIGAASAGGISVQAVGNVFDIVTDANGNYTLVLVEAGTYQIVEDVATLPSTVVVDGRTFNVINAFRNRAGTVNGQTRGVAVPGQDLIDSITLAPGETSINNSFGEICRPELVRSAQMSGDVYCDANGNGVRDPGEVPCPGTLIQLINRITGEIVETRTDANGTFTFTSLAAGLYRLREDASTLPATVTVNGQQVRLINAFRNRVGSFGGILRGILLANQDIIDNITLNDGENIINNSFGEDCRQFGLNPAVGISGLVYCDANLNGVRDVGEPGLQGVMVRLDYTGPNPGAVPFPLFATTSSDGRFSFIGQVLGIDLPLGTYQLTEISSTLPTTITGADGRVRSVSNLFNNRAGTSTLNGQTLGVAVPGQDVIATINLGVDGDASVNNQFGESCAIIPTKRDLLASSGTSATTPPAVAGAQVFATSPTFAGGVSAQAAGAPGYLVTAADVGGAPRVRVFDFAAGAEKYNFLAYSATFTGGVRVATGDITGDGIDDIITAPGTGGGPHVKVFDGATGQLVSSFMAYTPTFTGGVFVAAGDVNNDGRDDIITGAGEGGGPHVKVFDGATGRELASFFAFAPTFAGGVRVTAGDFNDDGRADVVTSAGPGGGPHVIVYDVNAAINNAAAGLGVLRSFMAYDARLRGGVWVSTGDINGDGRADLITGAGGAGAHVRVFDGPTFAELASNMAFDSALSPNGVRVGAVDVNGDGKDDIIAGSGPGRGDFVRVISGATGQELQFFQAFDPTLLGGTFVA